MKKILAVVLAVATLGAGTAVAAQSFDLNVQIGPRYERDYRYRDHDRRYEQRQEREFRRWYQNQRSYYRGRCGRDDVVVRDPYTQRLVCVDRDRYYQWRNHHRR